MAPHLLSLNQQKPDRVRPIKLMWDRYQVDLTSDQVLYNILLVKI